MSAYDSVTATVNGVLVDPFGPPYSLAAAIRSPIGTFTADVSYPESKVVSWEATDVDDKGVATAKTHTITPHSAVQINHADVAGTDYSYVSGECTFVAPPQSKPSDPHPGSLALKVARLWPRNGASPDAVTGKPRVPGLTAFLSFGAGSFFSTEVGATYDDVLSLSLGAKGLYESSDGFVAGVTLAADFSAGSMAGSISDFDFLVGNRNQYRTMSLQTEEKVAKLVASVYQEVSPGTKFAMKATVPLSNSKSSFSAEGALSFVPIPEVQLACKIDSKATLGLSASHSILHHSRVDSRMTWLAEFNSLQRSSNFGVSINITI